MKPADHSECDPAECIHRAALETYKGKEYAEDEYYESKRRARTARLADQKAATVSDQSLHGATTFGGGETIGTFGGVPVVTYGDGGRKARQEQMYLAEKALLKAREEMVAHGDPMPLQNLRNVVGDALRLADAKNEAYGDAWQKQGYMGNLARIQSKAARLKALLWRDADGDGYPLPANYTRDGETVIDTLLDLINLAGFMAVNWTEENRWG